MVYRNAFYSLINFIVNKYNELFLFYEHMYIHIYFIFYVLKIYFWIHNFMYIILKEN